MHFFGKLLATNAPAAVVLVRLLVGVVFLSEGIQKFLFPDALGVGRFAKIGIPAPEVMAPFVGVCEIVCGVLLSFACASSKKCGLAPKRWHASVASCRRTLASGSPPSLRCPRPLRPGQGSEQGGQQRAKRCQRPPSDAPAAWALPRTRAAGASR